MFWLYNTLLLPLRCVAAIWGRWLARSDERRREVAERMARALPRVPSRGVWIHGSSVGEARVVSGLARGLRARPDLAVAVSAFTPTGRAALPAPPGVEAAFFAPLDFRGFPGRVLEALRPRLLIIVETELWPNLLREAEQRRVPVTLINGRLSPRRMSRYRRFAALYRPLLRGLAAVGAQSEQDARRFEELGVPPGTIRITGNVKYDLEAPRVDAAELRQGLGLGPQRPVFVAGSTGAGEEPAVLEAYARARLDHPDLQLILAPRHPERSNDVERIVHERGLVVHRLSAGGVPAGRDCDVLLVDTLGQLARLYGLAAVAFVGGSLVPVGGHNVLEPAALGVPVLFGPHTEHFAEPAAALEQSGGGRRVGSGDQLGLRLTELLGDAELRERMARRAEGFVAANRGAMERSLELLSSLLDAGSGRAGADAGTG